MCVDIAGRSTFESAFDSLYPRAWHLAYRLVGDRAEAEDIASEALARAFVHWKRIEALPHRDAWVLRVAANLAIGSIRRRRPVVAVEEPIAPEDAVATRLALAAALRALPKRQREAVALRFIGDLSEASVAACLGISTGTVKSHTHRALKALSRQLGTNPLEGPIGNP
ncbi:MAG: sigma-70 family RNA polymerase sigma factor [Mycobacterium sp.]